MEAAPLLPPAPPSIVDRLTGLVVNNARPVLGLIFALVVALVVVVALYMGWWAPGAPKKKADPASGGGSAPAPSGAPAGGQPSSADVDKMIAAINAAA